MKRTWFTWFSVYFSSLSFLFYYRYFILYLLTVRGICVSAVCTVISLINVGEEKTDLVSDYWLAFFRKRTETWFRF